MPDAVSFSAPQKLSRNHLRDRPAPCVTPITCHAPGTAQQNVCTRPFGSMEMLSVCANTTPEVPMVVNALPSSTTPVPTAAAALSPAPPTTMVPAARPVRFAASSEMTPVTSGDSYTFGKSALSISSFSSTSSLQQRFGTSKSCMPEASETSVAKSPVSM